MTAAVLSLLYNDNNNSAAVVLLSHDEENKNYDIDDLSAPSLPEDAMMMKDEETNDDSMEANDPSHNSATTSDSSMRLSLPTMRNHKPVGLVNLGNTCYMNAALQMLGSMDELQDALKATKPVKHSKLRHAYLELQQQLQHSHAAVNPATFKKLLDEASPLFVGYRQQDSHEFLTTLLDLLHEDYEEEKEENSTQGETTANMETDQLEQSPEEEGNGVSVMETECESSSPLERLPLPSLSELEVQDIGTLLHGNKTAAANSTQSSGASLKEEGPRCKLVGGRRAFYPAEVELQPQTSPLQQATPLCSRQVATATAPPAQEDEQEQQSPIDDLFTTKVSTRLTCDSCKYSRTRTETYRCLSLEMGDSGNNNSVNQGLQKFLAPQQLSIKCEKCFCETASQTSSVETLPKYLVLHLKRFLVEASPDWTSINYRKNTCEVELPEELTELHQNYKAKAVIHHIGSSASCGHYTADAVLNKEWLRFNDSRVSGTTREEALQGSSRQTAYMVLYEME